MKKYVCCAFVMLLTFSLYPAYVAVAADGEAYVKKKCRACHTIPGLKSKGKKMGGDLGGVGSRTDAAWLAKWLKDPRGVWKKGGGYTDKLIEKNGGRKKTKMPIGVKNAEMRKAVVEYLMTLK